MSDTSTYYIDTGDGVTGVRYMADGTSVRRVRPAPEPLLTREEAANKMVTFFDHYCDDSPNWPMRDDAMKWLEVTDDE